MPPTLTHCTACSPSAEDIQDICLQEAQRLSMPLESIQDCIGEAHTFLIPRYVTCSPGYVGPVILVLWSASPGAVSTFIRRPDGHWTHCQSSSW